MENELKGQRVNILNKYGYFRDHLRTVWNLNVYMDQIHGLVKDKGRTWTCLYNQESGTWTLCK